MILENEFYNWLVSQRGLRDSAARVNVARIVRINNVYDVEAEYKTDGCTYLLQLFDYSTSDADAGLLPDHDIIIVGNYYTGTQSLKYALKRYIEFLDYIILGVKLSPWGTDEEIIDIDDSDAELEKVYINSNEQTRDISEIVEDISSEIPSGTIEEKKTVFMGSIESFSRYIGPFCKNYVNSIARKERNLHNGICEYCGKKAVLDSAHKDGEDRPIIIKRILEAHFKKDINYYEVDVELFEKMFKDAHLPVKDHIFFLCKDCHGEYDRGTKITTADILAKRTTSV